MSPLATFTATTGLTCLASGINCLPHGLPTTPDWAFAIYAGPDSAAVASLPAHLISRTSTAVIFGNPSGSGRPIEGIAQFVHAIQR